VQQRVERRWRSARTRCFAGARALPSRGAGIKPRYQRRRHRTESLCRHDEPRCLGINLMRGQAHGKSRRVRILP
jgi:hypothetical protein